MLKFIDRYLTWMIGLAIIAVIISKRSSTVAVLQTLASSMSNILGSIVNPINTGSAKAASENPAAPATPATAALPANPVLPAGTVAAPTGTTN